MSERSSIRDPHHHQCNNPSFSSTLLEEIYRSFDEERDRNHRIMTSAGTIKKSNSCYMDRPRLHDYHHLPPNRYFAVDRWIQNDKINLRRKSTPPTLQHSHDRRRINHSSSTSSSDSSSGIGGFYSSDTESIYGSAKSKQKKSSLLLKPIRTTTQTSAEFHRKIHSDDFPTTTKKKDKEGNLQRRALKLYSELKKVKQPISPGGKLSSFLNSLFHSKKPPHISSSPSPSPSPYPTSDGLKLERESPATTSRSCLSKTPSSAGRFERRSVRFVDENQRVHDRKCDVSMRDSSMLASDEDFKLQIKEKQRRVEEVAKELLKNYHHHNRKELTVNIVTDTTTKFDRNVVNNVRDFEEEDDDDDDVSCCSSDLFELENLLEIGMVDRYREELPVYETTHVDTNRAIANGFIL